VKAKNKCKLTQMLVKRLKVTGTRPDMVWDTLCYGLVFVVQPSGHRTFRFFYSIAGRPRWIDLGWIYLADAREIGFGLRADIARGLDPWAERRKKVLQRNITFGDLHKQYVTFAAKERKAWKQPDRLIRRYVLPKWGKIEAASITSADVRAMTTKIAAPILARQVLMAASAIYTWAMKPQQGILTANPCKGVEHAESKDRERVLSNTEIVAFWKEFSRLDPVRGAALKSLLLLGQRPGEVSHMRHEHIRDDEWWEMPGAAIARIGWPGIKNGQDHRVYLAEEVRDVIRGLRDAAHPLTGFVFATASGRSVSGLSAAMQSICERLRCERATPHDLRRSHGTLITGLGFGRDAMNRIQNHKEGGITDVYDRYEYAVENQKIMKALARHILKIAEGSEVDLMIAEEK
jgi:integrase